MSSVTFTNITKNYGNVKVIHEFNCVFNDKEFVTLLGPSGCGKTTMLRMIAGFEKPTTGEIRIDDAIVSSSDIFIPPNLRNIGMVFQSYAVWPHMNVFDNAAYPLKIQGVKREEIRRRVNEVLEAVHMSEYSMRMPDELSGGQQQRVALARALVSSPKLLLLDEPLSNLDAKLRESMRFEIKEMQKKFGITVVYVTHDQTEAMAMSDKIIVFRNGIVQQIDNPMNIYCRPANEFVADFVGRINFIRAKAHDGRIFFSDTQSIEYHGDKCGDVIVGVRPENIIMNEHDGVLKGIMSKSYYLGDVNECRADINGTVIRITQSGHTYGSIAEGAEIYLSFREFMVFDGKN